MLERIGVAAASIPAQGDRAAPTGFRVPRRRGGGGRERWAVVLAGGQGTRLRDFVREILGSERPKQFCRIVGHHSMLRHTWDRAARGVAPDRIVTVITAGQEGYLSEEASSGVPGTVLVQPAGRGTAPGLLLPLLWIARQDPRAAVAVFPADHFVWREQRFARNVADAMTAAEYWPHRLVLLGVEAEGPERDYGWIAPGAPVGVSPVPELYAVRRFWEKPDRGMAAHLFAAGSFWNTLVLVGRLQAYLRLAAAEIADVLEPLRFAAECLDTSLEAEALGAAYARNPPTNVSQAVLARRPEELVLRAVRGVSWSDWGDPARILRTLRRFDLRPSWLQAALRAPVPLAVDA